MAKKTYVSVVKAALAEGKTKEEILAIVAKELPEMDAKKAKAKLNGAIKYLETPKEEKVTKTEETI